MQKFFGQIGCRWQAYKSAAVSLSAFVLLLSLGVQAQDQEQEGYRNQRLLEYRNQVPVIDYEQATSDAVAELFAAIKAGETSLAYEGESGYLNDLLAAFGISPSSQVLVFSKTALKGRLISPEAPRAIYFNDEVYVAIVPGTPALEVASMDSLLGPVFYEIPQQADEISLRRHTSRCLSCHVKNFMTDGGVPIFMLQTTLVDKSGEAFSFLGRGPASTSATPLEQRWGGWYVSGFHGAQGHLGNLSFTTQPPHPENLDLSANGNRAQLDGLFDTSRYLTGYSDIVALMVMQHQVDVQNEIARVNYRVRTILAREGEISAERLAEESEDLLQALFMSDEITLTEPVSGTSGFTEHFQGLGPVGRDGKSLRELDLQERLFKYPLSYQIYTAAFDALPEQALDYLGRRIRAILAGEDQTEAFAHISAAQRNDMLAILQETKPALLEE